MMGKSVNVLVALEGSQIKECIAIDAEDPAVSGIYKRLQEIYGGDAVSYWNVALNDVPLSLWRGYTKRGEEAG